jgi:ABC-type transport system involved in multi-copper enzyme maturation permease subunit
MAPIFLLAKAFVRQNRWLLLVFVLWPLLLGALASPQIPSDNFADNIEIIEQEFLYGVAVTAFFASSAIYNERRSRRIVTILSKSVSRGEYLSGMLLGVLIFSAAYFVAVNLSLLWMSGFRYLESWTSIPRVLFVGAGIFFLRGMIACIWIASLSLFFSTFLHPIIAALLAGAATFSPIVFSYRSWLIAPMTGLIRQVHPILQPFSALPAVIALAESAFFLILAAQIFAKRDLNMAVE